MRMSAVLSRITSERGGAPGTIRTSDPQIRSLMLYPAELRVLGRRAFRRLFRLWQALRANELQHVREARRVEAWEGAEALPPTPNG